MIKCNIINVDKVRNNLYIKDNKEGIQGGKDNDKKIQRIR